MWLAFTPLVALGALLVLHERAKRAPPPDDALARQVAELLDAAPPELHENRKRWLVRFEHGGRLFEVSVHAHGGVLALASSSGHEAVLYTAPLRGKSAYDYAARSLVRSGDGFVVARGERRPIRWERRLPADLGREMQDLGVGTVEVQRSRVRCPLPARLERMRDTASLLAKVAELASSPE